MKHHVTYSKDLKDKHFSDCMCYTGAHNILLWVSGLTAFAFVCQTFLSFEGAGLKCAVGIFVGFMGYDLPIGIF